MTFDDALGLLAMIGLATLLVAAGLLFAGFMGEFAARVWQWHLSWPARRAAVHERQSREAAENRHP